MFGVEPNPKQRSELLSQLAKLAEKPEKPIPGDSLWELAIKDLNRLRPVINPRQKHTSFERVRPTSAELSIIALKQLGIKSFDLEQYVLEQTTEGASPIEVNFAKDAAITQGFLALRNAVGEFHGQLYDGELAHAQQIGYLIVATAMTTTQKSAA